MQQQQQQTSLNSAHPPHPYASNSITTDQIQKYLDENRDLILAIMENQNLGRLADCGQLQALLQKNLMYLAAIADAQPPPPGPSQVPSNSMAPQGSYMQQPQGVMFQQQPGGGVQKLPFQINALRPQDQQQLMQFQQQQMQGQAGFRPGPNAGMHGMHQAQQHGVGTAGGLVDARGNRQDGSDAASGEGQVRSSSARGSGN